MIIETVEPFLLYFGRVRERTLRVVDRIPPDRIEWTPRSGRFTLGDHVRHIAATERWMFAENVQGKPSRYPGCGPELADGYEEVVAYLGRMHEDALEIFRALTPDELHAKCPTPGGVELSTWKWLRAMPEHEIHHRGQIYALLGLLEVKVPPLYGLTEREVFANSVREGRDD